MMNSYRLIHHYVRACNKLTVPQAAAQMGVTPATWRRWETGETGMDDRYWPKFNFEFATSLHPDNVKITGHPVGIVDLKAYLDLLVPPNPTTIVAESPAPTTPEPTAHACVTDPTVTMHTCRKFRYVSNMSDYDCALALHIPLAQWQSWYAGRTAAPTHTLDMMQEAVA
jgi:DNA-binding transcriptional regulator YiaG